MVGNKLMFKSYVGDRQRDGGQLVKGEVGIYKAGQKGLPIFGSLRWSILEYYKGATTWGQEGNHNFRYKYTSQIICPLTKS